MGKKKAANTTVPSGAPAPIKKKKKWLRWVILAAVIIIGLVVGFHFLKRKVQNMLGTMASGVTEYTVERADLSNTISGTGNLSYASTENISIPQGIEIEEVYVSVGDVVTKGQELASVDQASAAGALYELNNTIDDLEETIKELPKSADDPESNDHLHKVQLEAQLEDLMRDREALKEIYETGVITAVTDGVMEVVNLTAGTASGEEIATYNNDSSLSDLYSMFGMSADPGRAANFTGLAMVKPRPEGLLLTSAGGDTGGEGSGDTGSGDEGGSGDSGSGEEGSSGDSGSGGEGSGDSGSGGESGTGDSGSGGEGSGDSGSGGESGTGDSGSGGESGSGDSGSGGEGSGGGDSGGGGQGTDPGKPDTPTVTIISQKQLSRLSVTAPAAGAKPQTEISGTAAYTGTIVWNAGETFEAGRTYLATIILFAKNGYAFGASENYTVSLPGGTVASGTPRVIGGNGVNGNAMLIMASYQTGGEAEIPQIDLNELLSRYGLTEEQLMEMLQQAALQQYAQLGGLPSGDISSYLSGLGGTDLSGLSGYDFSASADSALGGLSASNQMVAFTIASGEEMIVTIQISELDVNSVQVGQKAIVTLDAISEEEFDGKIKNIRTYSSDGNVTYVAEVSLDRAEGMRSGMSASAEVVIDEAFDVLVIPVDALQEDGDTYFVYTTYTTEKDGTVTLDGRQEIGCGLSNEEFAEVTEGLKEGDVICYKASTDVWAELEAMYGGGSGEDEEA